MINFGIIGCNCREHVIGKSLLQNNKVNIYYIGNHSNIGLDNLGCIYEKVDINNSNNVIDWCKKYKLEFVIIGPENPLENGIVDLLENESIKCFGPKKDLAKLETDKLFCRNFLRELENNFNIEINPNYHTDLNIINNLKNNNIEFVIKQIKLAGGKGVYVMKDHFKDFDEGLEICKKLNNQDIDYIIEEKLYGEEFSLFSITDGVNIVHCPPIQDYKRAYDNNMGPNTGGMGCIMNCLEFLNKDDIKDAENINELVLKNISKDDKYKGVLYGSFIKTKNGIKVIEYNCRFGDPEIICLFKGMKTDFYDICVNIYKEELKNIEFNNDIILTKYVVCENYPDNPLINYEFYVNKINTNNITWGNCEKRGEHNIQLGSRIFAYSLSGDNIIDLKNEINNELHKVGGRVYFREDIGNICVEKYKECGVNIDLGNDIVKNIQKFIKETENSSVLSKSGSFNGMIEYNNTVLVSSMDGVGTKSIFVKDILGSKGLINLGEDLVNHCINDILVSGAQPLFFLDYFASSTLSSDEVINFVNGVSNGCKNSNVILAGGETAEMPNVYKDNHCDLVGTIVGVLDKNNIIDGKKNIKEGDIILGLESNGLHTNGYSLLRKLIKIGKDNNQNPSENVIKTLCRPHKCYLEEVNLLLKKIKINGLCHITGGGLIDNPPRVLPKNLKLDLDYDKLFNDELYDWIKSLNYVNEEEMLKVFNCGYGMLVIISPEEFNKLNANDYTILGKIIIH